MASENRYDREHLRNISSYLNRIDEIYRRATDEVAKAVAASGAEYDPDKVFSFDDYPSVKRKVDRAAAELSSQVERTIVNGIKAQWELSNRKNDDLVETVTGRAAEEFPEALRNRYFATNEEARNAFVERATKGMNLSEEVWRFKRETGFGVDLSLKRDMDLGLAEGTSAADLSRQLRKYLKNDDMLFRRVRSERGALVLSRNARLFHPGQGVYRSSYMNARRLAATETNMAYRSADHERWKNLDFVVGIEIQTSNNHTTKDSKGKTQPLEDICDTLAGRYPKDFKFVGWHPHCRCIATTILKTEAEMQTDTERILNGEEPLPPSSSKNYEGNTPDNFSDWAIHNLKRIETARQNGTLPYFLKDNQKYLDKAIPPTLVHLYKSISNYQYTDPDLKAREGEIVDLLNELFDNSDFGLQIKARYFDNVLEDGEFKNQFQVGHSGGALESTRTAGSIDQWDQRLVISHLMYGGYGNSRNFGMTPIGEYGYLGKQWERSAYEKYGCLLDKDRVASCFRSNLGQYGDVQVRFNKDMIKDKCTFTFNDSLDVLNDGKWFQPTLVSDPHVESFDLEVKRSADDFINKSNWKNITDWQNRNRTSYVELQFHGKLPVKYIKDVTFLVDPRTDDDYMRRAEKCKTMGIEVWYIDGDKAVRY